MNKRTLSIKHILVALIIFSSYSCSQNKVKEDKDLAKPNVIYILADDLGIGDLGCYGQQKFKTPNIDRLASEGMLFTQHYSGATVCAPSRSSLLTGLHTGHTPIRGNRELEGEGQSPLASEAFTIAELMKQGGYQTGAFGKWGLGFIGSEGDPANQGFDEFYGYNCQRMAHRYYPTHLWHNSEKILLEGNDWSQKVTYAPDLIQEQALKFIDNNKNRPFFAFIPLVQPHAELVVPDDEILAQFKGKFEEAPWSDGKSYQSEYGAEDFIYHEYAPQENPHAVFAAMIVRIDNYVGQILDKLEELDLDKNTVIMFASDNGPHVEGGADPAFFNSSGGLRGVKRDLYEGGIRSPLIVRWINKIEAGSRSDHVSAFWDMMPTLSDLSNQETPSDLDGISFLPTLLDKGEQAKHEYLYWEFPAQGGRQALRMGDWKAVIYNINNGEKSELELYNLAQDKSETINVASEHPSIVEKMKKIMQEEHVASEMFPLY